MKILGIETSCDETAASLLEISAIGKIKILSSVVSSQIKTHQQYGGIVPEVAARKHVQNIIPVIAKSIKTKSNFSKIDLIAVTSRPGLITSLQIGVQTAKTLAYLWRVPLIGINHLEAHIYSNWLSNDKLQKLGRKIFPAVCLLVSGGHTELILMKNFGQYELLGQTRDDAVGEAFDKVAKLLNLGYPGGPVIERYAKTGQNDKIEFPRPMIKAKNFDFSFSGLKTAVRYYLEQIKTNGKLNQKMIQDICSAFQKAVVEVLTYKTIKAATEFKAKTVLLGGGVSANKLLRSNLKKQAQKLDIACYYPKFKYTQDNAVMIALAGYFNRKKANLQQNWQTLTSNPNLKLTSKK
ncbi:tRNA (adenosine(37)-N6)-threonylcarbamoyltransferase complex transferase subunit TsaD [Patescibacteria group bacterium]|nr:tRNA (adenosine(37)-N6)-threonylcarbamoyltransferase complex transferase subunit TsaD [Patescibacteria group bacterium]